MRYHLRIHDLFWEDVRAATIYYTDHSRELADRFNTILLEAIKKVHIQPENYFNISKKFRRIRLITFPYQIVYFLKHDTVVLVNLRHEHSRSKDYVKRAKDF